MNRSLILCSGSEPVGGKSSLLELWFRPSSWFKLGFSLPNVLTSVMTQAMPDEDERGRKTFKVSFTMTMWSPAQRCEERTDIPEPKVINLGSHWVCLWGRHTSVALLCKTLKWKEGVSGENRIDGACFLHNFEGNGKKRGNKKEKWTVVKPFLVLRSVEAKLVRQPFKGEVWSLAARAHLHL